MPRSPRVAVSQEIAERRFRSRIGGALRRLLGRREPASKLELVRLPAFAVTFAFGEREALVLVDAFDGHATLADPRAIVWDSNEHACEFRPTMTSGAAISAAREALVRARQAQRNLRSVELPETPRTELMLQPYWAYYSARLSGKLDAKLLDAVTGRWAGPRVKIALLAALASRRDS